MKPKLLFNIYNESFGTGFAGNVWDVNHICPTLQTMQGGGRQPMILEATACAIRKREEPTVEVSDREYANSLTTIQKDSMIAEKRIRKLTPKECFRLMGFDDEDYEKAHAVCSDTQLYKQAGNSIVVNVLEAIIGQMLPKEE